MMIPTSLHTADRQLQEIFVEKQLDHFLPSGFPVMTVRDFIEQRLKRVLLHPCRMVHEESLFRFGECPHFQANVGCGHSQSYIHDKFGAGDIVLVGVTLLQALGEPSKSTIPLMRSAYDAINELGSTDTRALIGYNDVSMRAKFSAEPPNTYLQSRSDLIVDILEVQQRCGGILLQVRDSVVSLLEKRLTVKESWWKRALPSVFTR